MKRALIVSAVLLLTACRTATEFGKCVGLTSAQQASKDSTLVYDVSIRNVVWSIIGFEFIVPPVMLVARQWECPIARLPSAQAVRP